MRADGEGYLGNYVKVIHDFQTSLAAEVDLVKGDIFKVTKVIDRNWLHGTSKDKAGNFPTDFVEKVQVPLTEEGQKVYAALDNFPAQQDGDLDFQKGDVIIGLSQIDEFWWNGQKGHVTGMFPITHVMELEQTKLLKQRSKSVHANEPLFAQALVDAVPQLDSELGFQMGDIIMVTEVIDEDWYMGEVREKSGMFLAACVQLLNEDECNKSGVKQPPPGQHVGLSQQTSCDNSQHLENHVTMRNRSDYENHKTSNSARSSHSDAQNHQSSSNKSDLDHKSNRQSSRTSSSSTGNRHSSTESNTYTSENTKAHNDSDAGVTPYARTLYQFTGELPDELSFTANDIVTLIQHVDEQWIEGEIDGKIGVFPANYVEIVVDCPYAFSTDIDSISSETLCESADAFANDKEKEVGRSTSNVDKIDNESKSGISDQCSVAETEVPSGSITAETGSNDHHAVGTVRLSAHVEEEYALVLYTFVAESTGDLSVSEGETVTVIRQIDENWILVRNDNGQTGMCPASFVNVIGATPSLPETCDKSDKSQTESSTAGHSDTSKIEENYAVRVDTSVTEDLVTETSKTRNPNHDNRVSQSSHDSTPVKLTSPHAIKSTHPHTGSNTANNQINTDTGVRKISKPQLKPKPSLAPKPAMKPKPLLSPKPFTKPDIAIHKPLSFEYDASSVAGIPKSLSSKSLSQYAAANSNQTGSMTKAQSMFEINNRDLDSTTNLEKLAETGSNFGSDSSLTPSIPERRQSTDSESKKAFENWDLSKPLDSLLQDEFSKAKQESGIRSRSSTQRSSGSSSSSASDAKHSDASGGSRSSGNYSRENFESALSGGVCVGNSTFYSSEISNSPNSQQLQKSRYLRKPPPPPSKASPTSGNKPEEFTRKPSLKKPAPPRPAGPRVAPAPSRTPIIPERTVLPKIAASIPNHAGKIPPRPLGGSGRRETRPAPPRPQVTPNPVITKSTGNDLMAFSPSNSSVVINEDDNGEEIQDIKTEISRLDKEIEDLEKCRSELELMQQNVEDGGTEIHDNIEFYTDNIQGLNNERATLNEKLCTLCPVEKGKLVQAKLAEERRVAEAKRREDELRQREIDREERMEKRTRVIDELIQTEKDYLMSLSLILDTFLGPTAIKHKEVDVELLCGNIEEVLEVSQKLLTKLEEATCGKDFTQQVIGSSFVCLAEDMKNVYAPYCRNHDSVLTVLEKYYQNEELKAHFERVLDKLREQHVVFDLEAMLIKPVQRILKYPLLLNELYKSTEEDHADKKQVLAAINAMTNVAQAINEYKRRKDLVYKYKKDSDISLGDKLSKLSIHSIKKKSSRIKERFSANMGFIDQTRDTEFDREETRFRQLEKSVRIFVRDVQSYLEEIQGVVSTQDSLSADIEDFYAEKRDLADISKYQEFHGKIHMTFLPNFQMEVDDLVIFPLNQLTQTFEGPNKVIQKRYDKLLDYDNMKRKSQNDKTFEKPMQVAKQNYEALNAQLLDELPRLINLSSQLLRDCVGSFVRAQREFTDKVLKEMYAVVDLQVLHNESIPDQFNIQHTVIVDRLALLSFMPRTFSPRVADQKQEKKNKRMSLAADSSLMKSNEAVPQLDSQKIYVTQQYVPGKLFRVTETHIAVDAMDISVCAHDVVGVIIEKDPMGNKQRWFVDNGAKKGFLPKTILTAYEATPPKVLLDTGHQLLQATLSTGSSHSSGYSPGNQSAGSSSMYAGTSTQEMEDEMDFALGEEMVPDLTDASTGYEQEAAHTQHKNNEDIQLYYAEFAFSSRTDNEVTLFEHQVVTVITPHDQNGNPEWWYVEADGVYGYAPAAYLRRMDAHNPS